MNEKEREHLQSQQMNDQNYYKISDENFENLIIRGDEYELENEVALSDIDYTDIERHDDDFDFDSDQSSSYGMQEMTTIKYNDGQVSNK